MTKGVLFHQDNAPVHKPVVAMAAVRDCGFKLVDHPPCSRDLAPSDYFLFPNMINTWLGSSVDRWRSHICSWWLSRGSGWELLYHGNPSVATQIEEVCGLQGRLCWKINHICSNSIAASYSQPINFSAHPRIINPRHQSLISLILKVIDPILQISLNIMELCKDEKYTIMMMYMKSYSVVGCKIFK